MWSYGLSLQLNYELLIAFTELLLPIVVVKVLNGFLGIRHNNPLLPECFAVFRHACKICDINSVSMISRQVYME